jgi:hypothetical protein
LYAHVDAATHTALLVLARADGGDSAEREVAATRSAVAAAVRELLAARRTPAPAQAASGSATSTPTTSAPPTHLPSSNAPSPRAPSRSRVATAPSPTAATAGPPPSSDAGNLVVLAAPPPLSSETIFAIALDGGIGARRLQYHQPITSNLPSYSVGAVPWLGFRAELHPFTRLQTPVLRGLGAFGDFGHSLYQQSVVAGGGPRVSADWMTYDVGLHERVRIGRSRFAPLVGVVLAYGRNVYDFTDAGQIISETPSVDYRYLRPALDARFAFGPVVLSVDTGYRAILAAGYVGDRFPRASIGGLDVGAGIAVRLPRDLELRLTGQYQRYFYDFHAQPGDAYVAGGAVDEFAIGELALAYGF